jgi:hypothetical protein
MSECSPRSSLRRLLYEPTVHRVSRAALDEDERALVSGMRDIPRRWA